MTSCRGIRICNPWPFAWDPCEFPVQAQMECVKQENKFKMEKINLFGTIPFTYWITNTSPLSPLHEVYLINYSPVP